MPTGLFGLPGRPSNNPCQVVDTLCCLWMPYIAALWWNLSDNDIHHLVSVILGWPFLQKFSWPLIDNSKWTRAAGKGREQYIWFHSGYSPNMGLQQWPEMVVLACSILPLKYSLHSSCFSAVYLCSFPVLRLSCLQTGIYLVTQNVRKLQKLQNERLNSCQNHHWANWHSPWSWWMVQTPIAQGVCHKPNATKCVYYLAISHW